MYPPFLFWSRKTICPGDRPLIFVLAFCLLSFSTCVPHIPVRPKPNPAKDRFEQEIALHCTVVGTSVFSVKLPPVGSFLFPSLLYSGSRQLARLSNICLPLFENNVVAFHGKKAHEYPVAFASDMSPCVNLVSSFSLLFFYSLFFLLFSFFTFFFLIQAFLLHLSVPHHFVFFLFQYRIYPHPSLPQRHSAHAHFPCILSNSFFVFFLFPTLPTLPGPCTQAFCHTIPPSMSSCSLNSPGSNCTHTHILSLACPQQPHAAPTARASSYWSFFLWRCPVAWLPLAYSGLSRVRLSHSPTPTPPGVPLDRSPCYILQCKDQTDQACVLVVLLALRHG